MRPPFALLALSCVCAAFAAAPPAQVPSQVLKLIDQLGDDEERTRDDATKALREMGEDVLPALRRAGRSHTDADVRLRCLLLVGAIERKAYREVRRFVGHTDGVYSVSVSPDGKRIVSGSWNGNREPVARVWDVATGKEVHQLKAKQFGVHAADWSPDGKRIVTGGGDSMLRVWDAATGKELHLSGMPNVVLHVRFLPDGKRFVASYNRWVGVYDLRTTNRVREFQGSAESVRGLAVSTDGKRVVTSGTDATVRLFETDTGKEVRRFTGHEGYVPAVALSPDGKRLLSGGHDRTARLWEVATGKELRSFTGHAGRVLGVAWSRDGRRMISTSDDKAARVWDVASGKLLQTLEGHTGEVTCAAFLPGDRFAVTGAYDNTLRLCKKRP